MLTAKELLPPLIRSWIAKDPKLSGVSGPWGHIMPGTPYPYLTISYGQSVFSRDRTRAEMTLTLWSDQPSVQQILELSTLLKERLDTPHSHDVSGQRLQACAKLLSMTSHYTEPQVTYYTYQYVLFIKHFHVIS